MIRCKILTDAMPNNRALCYHVNREKLETHLMREKIITLTVCITLVYWLGGLMGCATSPRDAQNEDMLKEDKSIFDVTPPDGGGNQFQTQAQPQRTLVLASMQSTDQVTESVDVPATMSSTAPAAPVSDTGVSVTGIDRSGWDTIDVSPDYGVARHASTYFADQPGRLYTHTVADLSQDNQTAMETVLDDTERHTFKKREWASAGIQPLKFCWDLFTLPYNATIKEPFWKDPYAAPVADEVVVSEEPVVEAQTQTSAE
jgi:hypothetical protein